MTGATEFVTSSADERAIPGAAVRELYAAEGWWPERTAADIEAVTREFPAVGAWRGDRLVGFARAITDGRFHAYIDDVVVAPGERGNGVGRAVVDHLMGLLGPVPVVTLFCGADLAAFYESVGFTSAKQVILHRQLSGGA